ncbi:hypothetical protein TNCV_698091 [Trichonephila clavipes]|nr:hypothetical protein TNCV_698091 [Trichonephila clavipes]
MRNGTLFQSLVGDRELKNGLVLRDALGKLTPDLKDLVAQVVRKSSPAQPSNASRRHRSKQADEKIWRKGLATSLVSSAECGVVGNTFIQRVTCLSSRLLWCSRSFNMTARLSICTKEESWAVIRFLFAEGVKTALDTIHSFHHYTLNDLHSG